LLLRPAAASGRSGGCSGSRLAWFALCLFLAFGPSPTLSADTRQVQVRHVVDGDTLVLDSGETVRLAGINTPELGQNGQPDQPLAAAATRALRGLVGAGTVVLEEATEREDRYGRTLAYLTTADGRSIQAQLLRRGLASAVAVSPNVRYLQRYAESERAALAEKSGIWGLPYYRPRPATSKAAGRGGYAFVYGKVQRIEIGDRWFAFSLAKHFVILVPRADWVRYFDYPPRAVWTGPRLRSGAGSQPGVSAAGSSSSIRSCSSAAAATRSRCVLSVQHVEPCRRQAPQCFVADAA